MISCVFIHLADEDSVVKGEPGVNKPSFRRAGGGYTEIAGKYILVKTTTHPLYTMLTIDPKFGRPLGPGYLLGSSLRDYCWLNRRTS